jgi:DNA-binding transcriptional LysR family regulator
MLTEVDLDLVLTVVTAGSVRGAAAATGAHPATVYRHLGDLQRRLGAPAFERIDGRYRPTEIGREIAEAAVEGQARLAELNRRVGGADARMAGLVRVTTTDSLSEIVSTAMAAFVDAYPDVTLQLSLSNSFADIGRHEAEVAIRPTVSPPETLVGRRAARFDYRVYARPDAPDRWIGLDRSLSAIPSARWLAQHALGQPVAIRADSMRAAADLCRAVAGRAVLPTYLAGGLTPLSPPIAEIASEVWVLTHADFRRTPRVAAFTQKVSALLREAIEGA